MKWWETFLHTIPNCHKEEQDSKKYFEAASAWSEVVGDDDLTHNPQLLQGRKSILSSISRQPVSEVVGDDLTHNPQLLQGGKQF